MGNRHGARVVVVLVDLVRRVFDEAPSQCRKRVSWHFSRPQNYRTTHQQQLQRPVVDLSLKQARTFVKILIGGLGFLPRS
jgi:hypothetical protein